MELTQQTILILFATLAAAIFILFILCIVLFVKLNGQKKRYDYFMGSNRRPTHNLEMKIEEYFETSKKIESQYSKLLDMVTDMDKTDKSKIQKVGLITPLMKWAAISALLWHFWMGMTTAWC